MTLPTTSMPEPSDPSAATPAPHATRLGGLRAELVWAVAVVASGFPVGLLWRGLFGLRSSKEWGVEGFFAVDGLLLIACALLGIGWGVAFLVRPSAVPLRRYLAVVIASVAAAAVAWQVGRALGMPDLTVPGVIVAAPFMLGLVGVLGSTWRSGRS